MPHMMRLPRWLLQIHDERLLRPHFTERRRRSRETVSMLATYVGLFCAPVVGLITLAVAEESTPWIAVIGATILTAVIVPSINWMRKRIDTQSAEAAEAQKRREEKEARREQREDERHEAFQTMVGALGVIGAELRQLNDHHKAIDVNREKAVIDITKRIDEIPDKVAKKLNGE